MSDIQILEHKAVRVIEFTAPVTMLQAIARGLQRYRDSGRWHTVDSTFPEIVPSGNLHSDDEAPHHRWRVIVLEGQAEAFVAHMRSLCGVEDGGETLGAGGSAHDAAHPTITGSALTGLEAHTIDILYPLAVEQAVRTMTGGEDVLVVSVGAGFGSEDIRISKRNVAPGCSPGQSHGHNQGQKPGHSQGQNHVRNGTLPMWRRVQAAPAVAHALAVRLSAYPDVYVVANQVGVSERILKFATSGEVREAVEELIHGFIARGAIDRYSEDVCGRGHGRPSRWEVRIADRYADLLLQRLTEIAPVADAGFPAWRFPDDGLPRGQDGVPF